MGETRWQTADFEYLAALGTARLGQRRFGTETSRTDPLATWLYQRQINPHEYIDKTDEPLEVRQAFFDSETPTLRHMRRIERNGGEGEQLDQVVLSPVGIEIGAMVFDRASRSDDHD